MESLPDIDQETGSDSPVAVEESGVESSVHGPHTRSVRADGKTVTELSAGRRLEVTAGDGGSDTVVLRAPDGEVELTIEATPEGPRLRFHAAEIELASDGRTRIDCEDFEVDARRDIRRKAGGDLVDEADGVLDVQARACELRAGRGDVRVKANDDVKLKGERIRLNC